MNRRSFVSRISAALLAGGLNSKAQQATAQQSTAEQAAAPQLAINNIKRSRPNILLLMADQLRMDCVGAYGNTAIRTPNIDSIAREGVRFLTAYSAAPSCTPARSALLTGMGPWRNGLLGYGAMASLPYTVEKPKALAQAGYYTTSIGKNHYNPIRNAHGYHQLVCDEHCSYWFHKQADTAASEAAWEERCDYESWFWSQLPGSDPHATGLSWNDNRSKPFVYPEHLHATHWTGATAVNFLSDYNRPEPFFLKVSFIRPHCPYDAPKRFFDMYENADLPSAQVGTWAAPFETRSDSTNELWHGKLSRDEIRNSRLGYYASVSFVDEQIGHILEVLRKRNLLEETLILFISDHGDMLGDQNHWRKSYAYEQSAHIPMLMRIPAQIAISAAGTTMPQPVELRDILPTMLDCAGAAIPDSVEGRSLLDLVRTNGADWRQFIDLEHDVCYSPSNHWNALTDGKWKFIYHAQHGTEQLFHLETDPNELRDLSADPAHTAQLKLWRHRLAAHLAERGPAWVKDGNLVPRPEGLLHSPNFPGYAPAADTLKKIAYGA